MSLDLGTAWALLLYLGLALLPGLALLRLAGWGPRHPQPGDRVEDEPSADGIEGISMGGGDPWLSLGLAAGIGLALQPLAYLWARLLGIPVGSATIWSLLLLSAAYLAWDLRRSGWELKAGPEALGRELRRPESLALAALLALLMASRWWALRELGVPMFGDSLHHTMILRLFDLQAGLPRDWRPFAELSTFTYHFGLHAGAASLGAIAGLPAPRSLIVTGQALMLLQALTAYALVAGWTGRRWAGLGAALAAGGLSTMPAFYANWGRYTQLAGQVLLPAALLATTWAVGARESSFLRRGLLAALAVAGLALTHYIVTLLYGLAVLAWLGPGIRGGWRARRAAVLRLGAIALAALALAAPWIPPLLAGPLDESATKLATTRVADPDVYGVVSPWQIWNLDAVDRNLGPWLLVALALLGLVGLLRRERTTRVGLGWAGLIFLATYPQLLGLPVTGILKDFTIAIGAYLPAALVIGGGLGAAAAWLDLERSGDASPGSISAASTTGLGAGISFTVRAWLLAALIVSVAGVRAWQDRDLLDPAFQLVHSADEAAMAWIRTNTPEDARFLVGSFSAFGDTVQAGDDAGWWLPLLAEPRSSTLPPITYGIEQGFEADYRLQVNDLARLWQADLDGEATRAALAAAGVSHAYVGVTGRQLDRAALAASPYWRRIHAGGGAEVYQRLEVPDERASEPSPPDESALPVPRGAIGTRLAESAAPDRSHRR